MGSTIVTRREIHLPKSEIDEAVARVLASGWYILGQEVQDFEAEFVAYLGAGFGVGVGSGTDALTLALQAAGVKSGREVITVSLTAVATTVAIEQAGCVPVFVDINPETFTIDPDRIEIAINRKTQAIVPVHLYGHPCEMDIIMVMAEKHNLVVVEDCAQAHGARYKGQMVGTFGHAAAFSFYPTKNLGGWGDGGMVVTPHLEIADRVRQLRQYGWDEKRISQIKGRNSRMDELQAAILRVKLHYLDEWNRERRDTASHYNYALADTDLVLPQASDNVFHVYHQYVVRTKNRDKILSLSHQDGLLLQIHYPVPIHQQPAYLTNDYLPHTMQASREIFSLPIYPDMHVGVIQRVSSSLAKACSSTSV